MPRKKRPLPRAGGEDKGVRGKRPDLDSHKIIVGVDYGTTFTGVSYVSTAKRSVDDISVITTWPGVSRKSETVFKIPSRIAYPNENYRIQENKWGFQVESGMASYSWTKLLLDNNSQATKFDDETLAFQKEAGMPILNLPQGKDAVTVVADFLEAVYKHTINVLEKQITADVLAITPMEFWFTMPAIWSDGAQHATREAAKRAGFGSRPGDNISMISEPEAAAIAALKEHTRYEALSSVKPGDGVLVCDCGGGTVDITTYRILKTSPILSFEELCTGAGAKCGSTTIDRKFYELMQERFGAAFRCLPLKTKGPGSNFMEAFEQIKQDFGYSEKGTGNYELPLDISLSDPDPNNDVRTLFDPVVDKIKALIQSQITIVNRDGGEKGIKTIILAGGFGDSEYLRKALIHQFSNRMGIEVIVPKHPQAAIVKGAVFGGLDGLHPRTRLCRRHYGFSLHRSFRDGIDPDDTAYIGLFDEKKKSRGRMNWMIKKGEKMGECLKGSAPDRNSHYSVNLVGHLTIDFTGVDWTCVETKLNSKGIEVYRISFEVKMCCGAREGILKFTAVANGKNLGEAKIDFSKD
ncbi:hypothetical protein FQN49_001639 [Arthroderma sp. PD_2]|nr:hypothetical protein FQN49_001639 [Arthroderma sp. PD_2]